jgi:hypothetical protein
MHWYFLGLSLLGAAHDSRVKSVAAMSCWVDLAESFLGQGETIRKEAARVLQLSGELLGNVGEDLNEIFYDYFNNENLQLMYDYTFNSSAVNFVDKINENGASIFIANALSDSLFTPNQFPKFFNQLTTNNKHIEFAPGDHAGPEASGLFGIPNQVWTRATTWLDYYLKDQKTTPIESMSTVIMDIFNDNSKDVESYENLDEMISVYNNFYLDKRERLPLVSQTKWIEGTNRTLITSEPKDGEELASLLTGKSAHINGGIAFVSATIRAVADFPRNFIIPVIDRARAGVWISDRFKSTLKIRGVPKMSLTIVPQVIFWRVPVTSATSIIYLLIQENAGTLIVYLLDVNNLNEGGLFTYSPFTFKNATVGQPVLLDFDITMCAYNLLPESRLGVVISSHDVLFLDQNQPKAKISFLSGSFLSLPLHL